MGSVYIIGNCKITLLDHTLQVNKQITSYSLKQFLMSDPDHLIFLQPK